MNPIPSNHAVLRNLRKLQTDNAQATKQTQPNQAVLCEQDALQIVRCQSSAARLLSELTGLYAAQNPLLAELALRELGIVADLQSRLDRVAALCRSGA